MNFELDYNKLFWFAEKQVFDRKLNIEPLDLVNEAYIKFVESGKEYTPDLVRNFIRVLAGDQKGYEIINIRNTSPNRTKVSNHTCKICKEKKPIAGFYLITVHTVVKPNTICKVCQLAKCKERYEKNKQKILDRHTAWKEANKEKIRLKKKEYWLRTREVKVKAGRIGPGKIKNRNRKERENDMYQKQKELLTDWYIRKILNRHTITPELVEAKRQQLLAARQK